MATDQHTPEPWKFDGKQLGEYPIWSDRDDIYHCIGTAATEADARRIVACVNFLAPFTTEQIENGIDLVEEVNRRDIAEQQRDQLRAVCAEAYQMAGALGAPVEALDNLSAAAAGEPLPHETFLPVAAPDLLTQRDELLAALKLMLEVGKCQDLNSLHSIIMQARIAIAKADSGSAPAAQPALAVWFGALPESNGKQNWTVMLHRLGEPIWNGITFERTEFKDRARYEADRLRYLLGELTDEPFILDYDSELKETAESGQSEGVE